MKTARKTIALIGLSLAAVSMEWRSQAAITGQWDFKAGNLAATIGTDLYDFETPPLSLTFNTTAGFGIPNIASVNTNVMGFPKANDNYSSVYMVSGATANGGGGLVNQYTVIADVLYPSASDGKTRTLFRTDVGGEIVVNSANQLAVLGGGAAGGSVTPNVWHRLAVSVNTNIITLYVDGVNVASQARPGGIDGDWASVQGCYLFNDSNTNAQSGFVASLQFQDVSQSDGFIAALGTPVATGILTGPPPNPYVISESPISDNRFPGRSSISPEPLIQVVLADGTATVNSGSVQLRLNGSVVPATVSYAAPNTTISYQLTNILAAGSSNFVSLTYQDSTLNSLGAQWAFYVGPYVALPASAAQPAGSANTPGFIYRVAQAPEAVSVDSSLVRALQQLDGTLLNPSNGLPYINEADLTQAGAQPNGSYFVDQYDGPPGTVSFSTESSLGILPFTPVPFPGIPGTNGSKANFASDVLAYIPLDAGTYVFGVAVGATRVDTPPDNGYTMFCGANPRDRFSTVVGQYVRTQSAFANAANTNTFTFVAPVSGVYPFRLVQWQNNSQADLVWYYVDPSTGNPVLINDPAGSIQAYRVSSINREPYVAEVYPAPGGAGFPASAPIEAVLSDEDALQVASGSIKLYLNGTQVTPNSITKSGKLTTVLYNPNASRTTVSNVVELVYSDTAASANSFTNSWSFTIVVGGGSVPQVTGQWDFNNCDLGATVGQNLQYLDGPSGQTAGLTQFGKCSQFGIPTINGFDAAVMYVPGGTGVNGNKNFGYVMPHGISPNGGGTKVNQYTIIWDMYYQGGTLPFFNCQDTNNGTDGSLFLQGGAMGQGSGGYTMNHGNISTGWHRIAFAVDLSQNLITKWVDGVKAQDWVSSANSLDTARRAWQPTVAMFADGDGDDHDASIYVNSIQVRNGKLSDSEMVALGGPSGTGIPQNIPASNVTGQWDFEFGSLAASIGQDLQYLDGPSGTTSNLTKFGTCSAFSIPMINGVDAKVMYVPGGAGVNGNNNFGFVVPHGISPNGGGTKVNQYTIIWDMYYQGGTLPFFNCQNTNNTTDGSLFLQGGAMGQGSGGYTMNHGNITTGWHRIAFAADLSQNLITKWVDGVKAQDWVSSANALDTARRAWQPTIAMFADGDGDDHDASIYVKSIQISAGKMSDAEMVALGAPDGKPIPSAPQPTSVTGQWDFNFGDLSATVGQDLQYLDGPSGTTSNLTKFGTCSALGVPLLDGVDANVMKVPGGAGVNGNNNFGYIMAHKIAPNGGGTKVNQYTIIWDMYYQGGTLPFFNCQDTNNGTDGSLFLQGGAMGQGSGGYTMNNGNITTGWHRIAFAADLSQNLITKWVDGVKAQDWISGANSLDTARRAWQPTVALFADGDGDDHDATIFVKSIQVSVGKASDAYMQALGGPSPNGIPTAVTVPTAAPILSIKDNGNGTITVSWPLSAAGWGIEATTSLAPPVEWSRCLSGVVSNSLTLPITGTEYFRLHQ